MCKDVQKELLELSFKAGHQGCNINWDIQAKSVGERTSIDVKRHWKWWGQPLVQISELSKPYGPTVTTPPDLHRGPSTHSCGGWPRVGLVGTSASVLSQSEAWLSSAGQQSCAGPTKVCSSWSRWRSTMSSEMGLLLRHEGLGVQKVTRSLDQGSQAEMWVVPLGSGEQTPNLKLYLIWSSMVCSWTPASPHCLLAMGSWCRRSWLWMQIHFLIYSAAFSGELLSWWAFLPVKLFMRTCVQKVIGNSFK